MLISSSDIAVIANVGTSTVSNWKARYTDFPKARVTHRTFTLYDRDEIEKWLKARGKISA